MKKFASMFAVMMALVICLGAMTACSNGAEEETKKPTTSTSGDKNESKPSDSKPEDNKGESKPEESKPEESKPAGDKNEESTQPSTGDNNVPTETQPAEDNGESNPEEDTNAQG
jgi:cytoskeletal protein RodZ